MANKSIKENVLYAHEFGRRLTARITELGLTQTDVCKLTGISNSHLSQCMRGDHMPGAYNVAKLAKALGVTTDDLINFTV